MFRTNNRGAVLLSGIYLLSGLLIAGIVSFLAMTTIRYRAHQRDERQVQARLWAESGISDAMNRISHDPFWQADGTESFPALVRRNPAEDGYSVVVATVREPDLVGLTAEGFSGGSTFQLHQVIRLRRPALFSLIANQRIQLSDEVVAYGPVLAIDDVTVFGAAQICGSLQVGKSFDGSHERIKGPLYSLHTDLEYPALDIKPYVQLTSRKVAGPRVDNLALSDTLLVVTGSTEVSGLSCMRGTVLVEGDLKVVGNLHIEAAPGRLALIVLGNMAVEQRGRLSIKGPVYVAGALRAQGQGHIEGSIIADRITLGSTMRVQPLRESAYAPIAGLPYELVRLQYTEGPKTR